MISLNVVYKGQVSIVVEGDHATIEQEVAAAKRAADALIESSVPGSDQTEPTTPPTTTH